jgi:hypothetical protein
MANAIKQAEKARPAPSSAGRLQIPSPPFNVADGRAESQGTNWIGNHLGLSRKLHSPTSAIRVAAHSGLVIDAKPADPGRLREKPDEEKTCDETADVGRVSDAA